jgi:hypothetical protein
MKTSLVGPWEVLSGVPVAATTEVDEDIDGAPWKVLSGAPAAAITKVDEDVDGGPLGRCLILSSIAVCSGFYKKDVGDND